MHAPRAIPLPTPHPPKEWECVWIDAPDIDTATREFARRHPLPWFSPDVYYCGRNYYFPMNWIRTI